MTNKLKVLSLFDGISGCRQALKEMNIDCDYYASEIDKWAIQVAQDNHPGIKQIGDVKHLKFSPMQGLASEKRIHNFCNLDIDNPIDTSLNFDLLIGGFPCQSFSIAGNQKGFADERGQLFFEALRILEEVKPKYFIFENVNSMSKENKALIDEKLGVGHVMINSALVTAQQRKRIYWVGKLVNGKYEQVKTEQLEDKEIYLKDIIEDGFVDRLKSYCLDANYHKGGNLKSYFEKGRRQLVFNKPIRIGHFNKGGQGDRVYSIEGKSVCLSALGGGRGFKTGLYKIGDIARMLTVGECEKLQGFPENYCDSISKSQAYKALGNSFTVPVIKHILKGVFNV